MLNTCVSPKKSGHTGVSVMWDWIFGRSGGGAKDA